MTSLLTDRTLFTQLDMAWMSRPDHPLPLTSAFGVARRAPSRTHGALYEVNRFEGPLTRSHLNHVDIVLIPGVSVSQLCAQGYKVNMHIRSS